MALKTRSQTRDVAPGSVRAAVGTVNDEKRTVDVTFSTGARVLRNSYFDGPSYEELSMDPKHVRMDRLQSGAAPLLADHRSSLDNVIGVVESARIENGKGIATVRFAKAEDDPAADKIYRKVKDGLIRSVSIGYRTFKSEKVESGSDKIPVYRATDWQPHEISAVALPADADAGFRSDDATQFNPCVFLTRDQETYMTEEEKKALEAAELVKREAAKAESDAREALAKRETAVKAQELDLAKRERDSGVKSTCVKSKMGEEFTKRMLESSKSLAEVREAVIDEIATRSDLDAPKGSGGAPIEMGETDREKWSRGAEAGQLQRSGLMGMLSTAIASTKKKVEQRGDTAQAVAPGVRAVFDKIDTRETGDEFRGMSLVDTARDFLNHRGVKTRSMTPDKLVERALSYRDSGSEQTTSDFGTLLENLMYKSFLGFYAQADDTWRRWMGVDSVADFRSANRYRAGSFGVLDLKPEGDEYKHKKIPDGFKQQISVQTYGNKISLTREAIVNDDMGAVQAMAEQFGRAAGLSMEVAAYALLAQNSGFGPTVSYNSLSHALMNDAFNNVNDTGSGLSVTGLEADRVLMASQKDPSSNEYLNLAPTVLLIPIGLEGEAKVINRSTTDPTITAGNPTNRPNIVSGLFSDIIATPRLFGTRRYLFDRSGRIDSFKMVFLNGSQVPTMEQRPGWDIDGIEWKLRQDFKAMGFDPLGVVTNAGA